MVQMVSISCYQRLPLKRLEPTVVQIPSESTSEGGIAPRHRISSKMAFPLAKECILRVASDKGDQTQWYNGSLLWNAPQISVMERSELGPSPRPYTCWQSQWIRFKRIIVGCNETLLPAEPAGNTILPSWTIVVA